MSKFKSSAKGLAALKDELTPLTSAQQLAVKGGDGGDPPPVDPETGIVIEDIINH